MKCIKLLALGAITFLTGALFAQPNVGGSPIGRTIQRSVNKAAVTLEAPNLNKLFKEDKKGVSPVPNRSGKAIETALGLADGRWTDLGNGARLWQLEVVASGARSLGLYYDAFSIPKGGLLYVYAADGSQVLGAFNHENNPEGGAFATELVHSERVIIEYYEAEPLAEPFELSINQVAYMYRDAQDILNQDQQKDFGDADNCMINANCSEGDGWEDQKRSVARILVKDGFDFGWCSGALVNNTALDNKAYFLTAFHCGEGSSSTDFNQWVFYFNYQAPTCINPFGEPSSNTITGADVRSQAPDVNGSDFLLLELQQNIPTGYDVHYAGWSRLNLAPTSGISLHHPGGDIKKISTFEERAASSRWEGNTAGTHWELTWSETNNGLSVTQGGSSGAPLFDQNGRIVGTLTGGSSFCSTPEGEDFFGKLSFSWDKNGTSATNSLMTWLDPIQSGAIVLDGKDFDPVEPRAEFTANTLNICPGDSVQFMDISGGQPTTWEWIFQGGSPFSSRERNPKVAFNSNGTYNVTLTVSNEQGQDTKVKFNYIASEVVEDYPYTQNFDAFNNCINECGVRCRLDDSWANTEGGAGWITNSGTTPSFQTGPPTDLSGSGNYLYVEASAACNPASEAIVTTPCFDLSQLPNAELSFSYHMLGNEMGTLRLQVEDRANPGVWVTLRTLTGNQGDSWITTVANISSYDNSTVRFRFVGITGNGPTSDMAIDNFIISNTIETPNLSYVNCPPNIVTCEERVTWTRPLLVGGLGNLDETVSHTPGSRFPVGSTTLVLYSAEDENNDLATCSFTIRVTEGPRLETRSIKKTSNIFASDGEIEILAKDGTFPYTYEWTRNVSTSGNAENLRIGRYSVTVSDNNDCEVTESYFVLWEGLFGRFFDDLFNKNELTEMPPFASLFPNPTTDVLNVNLTDLAGFPAEIAMFDATGKQVKQWNGVVGTNHIETLHLSDLAEGPYMVHILATGPEGQQIKMTEIVTVLK